MTREVRIDAQVHGYRQGHQLISGTLELPRADQDRIDQLSDLAGPLRPGETFEPYVTAYPLPSGTYYVLARTWQDTTVPRAGCVRTLSLLIPTEDWANAPDLGAFFDLLTAQALPVKAHATATELRPKAALPAVTEANGAELLEALFLEESQPVAVFDLPERELVATRLLTALWPSGRAHFSLSTFALSPRRIGPNFFNLVFSPLDARPRFSDWSGRRVDGRASQSARHRWTSSLVQRVFIAPFPALLEESNERLSDLGPDSDPATALRVALLWDELIEKVQIKPTAILGLLDIADSRVLRDAREALVPILRSSANWVVDELPSDEAWDFIGAVVKKVERSFVKAEMQVLRSAISRLVSKDPLGAVRIACAVQTDIGANLLVTQIADSLAAGLSESAAHALIAAGERCLWKLLSVSERLLKSALDVPALIPAVAEALSQAPAAALGTVASTILPELREEFHLPVARTVFAQLGTEQIVGKFIDWASSSHFSGALVEHLVDRGRAIRALEAVRSALLSTPAGSSRDELLEATLAPIQEDVRWVLYEPRLFLEQANSMLDRLLLRSSHVDRLAIFRDAELAQAAARRVGSSEVLYWLLMHADLSAGDQISLALALSEVGDHPTRASAAAFGLRRALQTTFGPDEVKTITLLMERAGDGGDLRWTVDAGLGPNQPAALLNRNLECFDYAPSSCRHFFLQSIPELAKAVTARYSLDLDQRGAEALAHLINDSERVSADAHLEACGLILPAALRATQLEVSILIIATFPTVYQELGRRDQVPDFLNFIPFYDWNRCKAARISLVQAFMASRVWPPSHFALTACMSGDARRVLGRLQKSFGSQDYIERMLVSVHELPERCKKEVVGILAPTDS